MISVTDILYNSNGLSSRENEVLRVFEVLGSKSVSTETLRQLTGYGHKVLQKTIQKLVHKGYLEEATKCEMKFFKPDKDKLEEALEELEEESIIDGSSEIIS